MMSQEELDFKQLEPSRFGSIDPAPAGNEKSISDLSSTLCDEDERMFIRMRALFSLRNIEGEDAVDGLIDGFSSSSALLKHKITYVLGQMQNPHAVPALIDRLSDIEEDAIVRHEAAEALGAIGDQKARPALEEFESDPSIVVSQSCEVALDLLNWITSESFEYE
jgi:deoxyhypusine monooxygenase